MIYEFVNARSTNTSISATLKTDIKDSIKTHTNTNIRLKGQTLPLRFVQFDDSAVNFYVRTVAVSKDLQKHDNLFPFTEQKIPKPKKPKKTKPKKPKKTKTKKNKKNKTKKTKKNKKNIIPALFQNITGNMHKWKSSEIMVFCFFLVFLVLVFLFFLVFLVLGFLVFLVLVFSVL